MGETGVKVGVEKLKISPFFGSPGRFQDIGYVGVVEM
jgi:hypothetical protein